MATSFVFGDFGSSPVVSVGLITPFDYPQLGSHPAFRPPTRHTTGVVDKLAPFRGQRVTCVTRPQFCRFGKTFEIREPYVPPTYDRPIGPKMTRDPKFLYTPRERLQHALLKRFHADPFKFQAAFWRFLPRTSFYQRIYKILLKQWGLLPQNQSVWDRLQAQRHRTAWALFKRQNYNNFSLLEEESLPTPSYWGDYVYDKYTYVEPVRSVRKEVPLPKWDKSCGAFLPQIPPAYRDAALARKLRAKIVLLRASRGASSYLSPLKEDKRVPRNVANYYRWVASLPTYNHEIGGSADVSHSDVPSETSSHRVCIVEDADCSSVVIPGMDIVPNTVIGDVNRSYTTMTDDWLPFDEIQWTKDQVADSVIRSYILPAKILDALPDNLSLVPFRNHQYWRGDLEIKVICNSNPFQIGQLQLAWYYDTLTDKKFEMRDDMYAASQTPHAIINAGSSNEACFDIGYRATRVILPITGSVSSDGCLNLGTLKIRVLNRLSTNDTSDGKCNLTILAKFKNCEFFGPRNADMGSFKMPQMMEGAAALVAIEAAERVLDHVLPDTNRDNPPYPHASPHMIPAAMQSLCYGSNAVEPINALRLNATAQVPHLEKPSGPQTWSELAKVYGLVTQIEWKAEDTIGKALKRIDASPLSRDLSDYPSVQQGSQKCHNIPPVAIASSMFAQWRGCLRMRLDFVASQYHTGRIAVVYSPKHLDDITWKQGKSCPYQLLDLKSGVQSYTVQIPFMWYKYFCERTHEPGVIQANTVPGRVHIFVVNPLIPMDSVSNKVFINLYWAAGDNFELAIPAQPTFGTGFFTDDVTPSKEVRAYEGYYPWYWGYYGDFYGGKKAIARYGTGWQHVAQFQNLNNNTYYTRDPNVETKFYPQLKKNDGTFFTPEYFGPINISDGAGWRYMGIFPDEATAKKYAAMDADKKDLSLFMDVFPDDKGPWCMGNPTFEAHKVVASNVVVSEHSRKTSLIAEAMKKLKQMLPSSEACTDPGVMLDCIPCPQPNLSRTVYGETFDNIKDLCRRYQPYCAFTGTIKRGMGDASIAIPMVPQGLDINLDPMQPRNYSRFVRDGTIPIVSSAYRFHRCSMRMRLVVPPDQKCNIWIQHRPDQHLDVWKPKVVGNAGATSHFLNTGYATNIQTSKVNNTYSFEIPYYQAQPLSYCQRTNTKYPYAFEASSLGTIFIGFENKDTPKTEQFPCILFYSLGDDGFFDYFQGFPRMTKIGADLTNLQHEGWKDWMPSLTVNHKIEGIPLTNDLLDRVSNVTSVEDAAGVAQQFVDWLKRLTDGAVDFGIDLISQIIHCIINPVKETIAVAIVTILLKLNVINAKFLDSIISSIVKLMNQVGLDVVHPARDPSKLDEKGNALIDSVRSRPCTLYKENGDVITQMIDVAFVAVSTVTGVVVSPPSSIGAFYNLLTKNISSNVRTSNQITLFMKNNILFFQEVVAYCTAWWNKGDFIDKIIADDFVPLLTWIDEVEEILHPKNDERIFALDSQWSDRLEYAYAVGLTVNKHFSNYTKECKERRELYSMFSSLMTRLTKRREDMYKRGKGAISRREPFCIWLSGSAGVGKSQLAQRLIPLLLDDAGIQYIGESIFTLPSGAKHWSGCKAQPAILMDDFLNVQTGEIRDESVRHIFAIKSPAALNPPMAHLEEKELRYAPEILVICSNYNFPALANVENSAIYRRREMLIECNLQDHILNAGFKNVTDQPEELKAHMAKNNISMQNFSHLNFKLAYTPSTAQTGWEGDISYEVLVHRIRERFREYRSSQLKLYEERMAVYRDHLMLVSEDTVGLQQKQEEYRKLTRCLTALNFKDKIDFKTILRLSNTYATTGTISEEMLSALRDTKQEVYDKLDQTMTKEMPVTDGDAVGMVYAYRKRPNAGHTILPTTDEVLCDFMGMSARSLPGSGFGHAVLARYFLNRDKIPKPYRENDGVVFQHVKLFFFHDRIDVICKSCKTICDDTHPCCPSFLALLSEYPELCNFWYELIIKFSTYDLEPDVFDTYSYREQLEYIKNKPGMKVPITFHNVFDIVSGSINKPISVGGQSLDPDVTMIDAILPDTLPVTAPKVYVEAEVHDIVAEESHVIPDVAVETPVGAALILEELPADESVVDVPVCDDLVKVDEPMPDTKTPGSPTPDPPKEVPKLVLPPVLVPKPIPKPKVVSSRDSDIKGDKIGDKVFYCDHMRKDFCTAFGFEMDPEGEWWFVNYDNEDLRIKDGYCKYGRTCILYSEALGRALYDRWVIANPNSTQKPQYWAKFDAARIADKSFLEPKSDASSAVKRTSLISKLCTKLRAGFNNLYEKLRKLGCWIKNRLDPAFSKLWAFLKYLTPFLIIFGAIYGAYAFYAGASVAAAATTMTAVHAGEAVVIGGALGYGIAHSDNYVNTTHEAPTDYDKQTRIALKNPRPKHSTFSKFKQNSPINQHVQAVINRVTANTYNFSGITPNKVLQPCRVIALYENIFIVLKHYKEHWDFHNCDSLYVSKPGNNKFSYTVSMKDIEFQFVPEKSVGFCKIRNFPFSRKINSMVATQHEHERPRGTCYILEVMDNQTIVHPVKVHTSTSRVAGDHESEEQILLQCYEYAWHGPGRCGSVLINPALESPILGIHCAGAGLTGVADPISREILDDVIESDINDDPVGMNEDVSLNPQLDGTYVPLGRTDEGMLHAESGVSRIVPSLIAGVFPIATEPAPLKKGDQRVKTEDGKPYSPLWAGVSNMLHPSAEFPSEILSRAADAYTQRVISIAKPTRHPVGPIAIHDAIVGIPGMEYYDGLEMNTSEGYPMSRYRPKGASNKRWIFSLIEEKGNVVCNGLHQMFMDILAHDDACRRAGEPVWTIFDDCLKDSRLSLSKVSKPGKTRIFSISPVQHTVMFKKYFADYMAAFKTHRLELSHAVGINADSAEWGRLVRNLTRVGSYFITGDYKNFGPGLKVSVLRKVMDTMIAWYDHYEPDTPEKVIHQRVRECLLQENMCAVHCAHDFIYQPLAGLPSGCPATVELNCGVNEIYMLVAWNVIMATTEYAPMDRFYTHVYLCTYGDDLIASVSRDVAEKFNNVSLQNFFQAYGVEFTSSDKESEMIPYETSLTKCTFLKRGFKKHPTRQFEYLAPLDLDISVKDVANWTQKCADMHTATAVNAEACVRNAYGHGPIVHGEIKNAVFNACVKADVKVQLRSWCEYDELFYPV